MDASDQVVVEMYIRTTPAALWDAITNGDSTARYYFGSSVQSSWQPGAPVVYYGPDRSSQLVAGNVVVAESQHRLEMRYRLLYSPALAAEQPSHVLWEIRDLGTGTCQLRVVHDEFDARGATHEAVRTSLPVIVSSLKSLLETGQPLTLPR